MGNLTIQRISFWSYLRLFAVACSCFGLGMAVITFIASLIVPERVAIAFFEGGTTFTGLSAGLLSILFYPASCAVIGVISAVIGYLPFKLFLKIARGLKVNIGVS